jgi:hypothetical protein
MLLLLVYMSSRLPGASPTARGSGASASLELLLATPVSRRTLAAGYALALYPALAVVVLGAAAAVALLALMLGRPLPTPTAALAVFLLVSAAAGAALLLGLRKGSSPRRARLDGIRPIDLGGAAIALLFMSPTLERAWHGDAALTLRVASATAGWMVGHAAATLVLLLAAALLTNALAYRRFRDLEL